MEISAFLIAAAVFFVLLGAIWSVVAVVKLRKKHPETLWDWSKIDISDLSFPKNFIWGTATAAHQVEGHNTNNNWSRWEESFDKKGRPRIQNGDKSGRAADHYNLYRDDIARMKDELGVDSYRFSLEWSRIEPEPGKYDQNEIKHYHGMFDALLEAGIKPMPTLHHFTHPIWFDDLGSFEHEKNLEHFFRFSELCFKEYGGKAKYWCTHNEPGPFATMGWALGVFPPGVKNYKRLGQVLHNLMRSHLGVYQRIKALPGGNEAQVGLVKNMFQFDPYRRWSPLHWLICRISDGIYNESILGFLRDGVFRYHFPGISKIYQEHPEAKGATDFIGLNYYSNLLISPLAKQEPPFKPLIRKGQVLTDMPYATYPEGFYRALTKLKELERPIIVTENGVPDAKDDFIREDYIRRYLYAMSEAIKDGADVRGFYYWTLMDNFEWAFGNSMKFGLYEVNPETMERRLRNGSKAFVEIIAQHKKDHE